MPDPGDRERGPDDERLSGLADAYRRAGPILGASTSLVVAVGAFTWFGVWLDRRLGNRVPWFTIAGAMIGMTGGFISFFKTVLGTRKKRP